MRGMKRAASAIPTITDCFVLSFTFFLLSDIHQIIRDPTLDNLIRVLTSLQLTANSPFDYPAFAFLGLFLFNVAGIIWARARTRAQPEIAIASIPIYPGPITKNEAVQDCLFLAGALKERGAELGMGAPISMGSIGLLAGEVKLGDGDFLDLNAEIIRVLPETTRILTYRDNSPLTSLLLSILARIGLPIGGIYHPIQRKVSLNPSLDPISRSYVYIHEVMHSAGLGEVHSEIGAIEVCMRIGSSRGLPMDVLGTYLLFRSVVNYLASIGAIGEVEGQIAGLFYGWRGFGAFLIKKSRGRVEKEIYIKLKVDPGIRRQ